MNKLKGYKFIKIKIKMTPSLDTGCRVGGITYSIKRIFYQANGLIVDDDEILEIEALALQKGKFEEDERLIYDTLGNIVVIDLIEKENEIKENLYMMEDDISTTTSLTLFTRTKPVRSEKIPIFEKNGKTVISVKIRNFYRSRMMKRTSPLESSRKI